MKDGVYRQLRLSSASAYYINCMLYLIVILALFKALEHQSGIYALVRTYAVPNLEFVARLSALSESRP